MAFAPPPSPIFSSSFRTCETRSAIKRMLASKRAEVGSTLEGNRLDEAVDCETSLRSAMGRGLETDYGISAARKGANRESGSGLKAFGLGPAGAGSFCRCGMLLHGGLVFTIFFVGKGRRRHPASSPIGGWDESSDSRLCGGVD